MAPGSLAQILQSVVEANGRSYAVPRRPVVVICLDGFDPEYLEHGVADGTLPTIRELKSAGYVGTALATVPTTTNTNNTSIVTGVPPAIHGINGNYYLDAETGEEIMVTDARRLRCGTILGAMSKAGVQTAVFTAKDKLLKVLAYEMEGIAFSSEYPNIADLSALGFKSGEEMVGRGKPDQYSADLSLFALDAGLKLLERARPGLMYLSTSDYVQHKYQPGDDESNAFHSGVDRRIARMIELGATVALTADHGMAFRRIGTGELAAVTKLCAAIGPHASVVILDSLTADRFAQLVRGMCDTPTAVLTRVTPATVGAVVTGIDGAGRRPILLAENEDELASYGGSPRAVVNLLTTQEAHNLTTPPTRTWFIHYTVWLTIPALPPPGGSAA